MHFVWNAVDMSIIIIFHPHSLCENPLILYANFEPNTMLLSSKNNVRTKMYLEVRTAVCHPDFSELLLRDFHILNFFFSSHAPSGSHVELIG